MKKFSLIVAGGKGLRMGSQVPKQFLNLNGKPVLMHTIEAFTSFDPSIQTILVLPESQFDFWEDLCKQHGFKTKLQLVLGGANRTESVKNGLSAIKENGIVFIHDGVRPLLSKQTIQNCLDAAIKSGCSIPVIPLTDSIRSLTDSGNNAVDRNKFCLVQTPQTFEVNLIKKAFEKAGDKSFSDDATVAEAAGHTISLVEGNTENIKITRTFDLKVAELFLKEL